MRKLISSILLFINIILAILLLAAYGSVYISPDMFWVFAFIGFAYPFILIANVLFVLLWSFFGKWYLLISLVCVLVGMSYTKKYFRFASQKTENISPGNSFKLLTYNVRLFNYYQWHKDTSYRRRIIEYVQNENPDILCFQEFVTLPEGHYSMDYLKSKLKRLPYIRINYTYSVPRKINFGLVTFSRYPITNQGIIKFKESLNGIIFTDIVIGKDTIRIYNCHLQSLRLKRDYSNFLDSLIFNYSDKKLHEIKYLSTHMRTAFIKRASQVDILSDNISTSPYPVIVCGDFNDTPVSYTYFKLSQHLNDAFIESGRGFGNTYRGNLSYMRIDYILSDPALQAHDYHSDRIELSDHYPVWCNFTISQKADSIIQHSRR